MSDFQVASILISLTAALAYINARVFKLPSAIGLMATALGGSILVIVLDQLGITDVAPRIAVLLDKVDLSHALLHGMLGVLLFAGALHVDLGALREYWAPISVLALVGTLVSTAIVGAATFACFGALGYDIRLVDCLLFGALISPTDPIAVLGILKKANAPKSLEITITGESLFNDGVGVVVFLAVLGVATGGGIEGGDLAKLFAQEALGGVAFGGALGFVGYHVLRSIDQYSVEILITLAMVLGGYAAAEAIHVSAPIAAVVAGLMIGNQGRAFAMSDTTREHLDTFWELIDEILNAVLFLLIGLEIIHLRLSGELVFAAALVVPIVIVARWVSVSAPLLALGTFRRATPGAIPLLTWGGLRGGISVALALSIPASPARDLILTVTYAVVVFSILVQGTTLGMLTRRYV